ncbi:MAG: hypothetical protein V9G19_15015 [Tetrasphaera sp.]
MTSGWAHRLRRWGPTALAVAATLIVWLGPFRHYARWTDVGLTDIPTYEESAGATAAGRLPYRDIELEYPPGAALVFYLARFLPGGNYTDQFRLLMLIAWTVASAGGVAASTVLRLGLARQAAVGAIMAATPVLLGSLLATRYDGLVTAVMAWMLVAAVAERWRWMWGLLVAAILLKLMPVVLVPSLALWQWHRAGAMVTKCALAGAGLATAAVVAPFAIVAPHGLWGMLAYHLRRPAQIESSASSYLLAWHLVADVPVTIATQFGSQGPVGWVPTVLATASSIAGVAAVALLLVGYARRLRALPKAQTGRGSLVTTVAATIVVLAVGSKVLSPQYLLWMMPAALLLPGPRGRLALTLLPVVMLLTQWYFPKHYWELVALDAFPIIVLCARNLLLLVLAVLCWPRLESQAARQVERLS